MRSLLLTEILMFTLQIVVMECRTLPTADNEIANLLRTEVQFCGASLTRALHLACQNGSTNRRAEVLGGEHASASGQKSEKIVEECCWKPCAMGTLVSYCENGLYSKKGMELLLQSVVNRKRSATNELKLHVNKDRASPKTNQVRGKTEKVRRKEREDERFIGELYKKWETMKGREGSLEKPFTMKCMYPSFAHYLLEKVGRRKRREKVIKQAAAGLQVGTVAPFDFGGRPIIMKLKSGRGSSND